MGLELRKNKNGNLVKNWYGSFINANGKRKVIPLSEPLPENVPSSLKEKGDEAFEKSRARALAELNKFQDAAREKGRSEHLTEQLIEARTGRKWVEMMLVDLPAYTAGLRGRRSAEWKVWQVTVVQRFVDWAAKQGLHSVLEITPEIAEGYIESLNEPDESGQLSATSTIRHIKNICSRVITRVLPNGVENPFKNVRIETPEGGGMEHRKPLNAEEVDRLLKQAETEPLIFPLIVTALSTGLRRGDVCRLKWSEVNLQAGTLTIKTSKTGAAVVLPIMDRLRDVLESALAERKSDDARFVFPEAERMLRNNPDGITYRVKKVFAQALALPQEAAQITPDTPERVPLATILPEVLDAVQATQMTTAKRDKLIDILTLYAEGKSYREIEALRNISRGGISGLLHEAQKLANVSFLPDSSARPDSIKKAIKDVTRKTRTVGMRDASKYDFHSLRTTFVTLALSGENPMPVEKVIALTGHRTVETAMKHYFKPKGSDFRNELEAAMPKSLSGRRTRAKAALPAVDTVAGMAEQVQAMSAEDKARLMELIGGAE